MCFYQRFGFWAEPKLDPIGWVSCPSRLARLGTSENPGLQLVYIQNQFGLFGPVKPKDLDHI